MKYSFLPALLIACSVGFIANAPVAVAQKVHLKTEKATPERKAVPEKPTDRALQLINEYRFDEAATQLDRDVKAAERAGRSTAQLEELLRQARLGATMLRGTEKVIFVDSMVVPRDNFLSAYKLSRECGTIAPLARLIPALAGVKAGQTAHVNDLGDRVIFAAPDSTGLLKLQAVDRLGDRWSRPQRLTGMGSDDDIQDFPFMMADGVTLYYAAQSSESLGGYDIFVTRYNNATGQYVKAENVGMPFNSPANDYLMAIDETTGVGWFVSDRRQPASKVCIYRFIPNDSKEVYDVSSTNVAQVRRLARIASLAESQTDAKAVADAKARLKKSDAQHDEEATATHRIYVIDDDHVYTSLAQFHNAEARTLATQADALQIRITAAESHLEALRNSYIADKNAATAAEIKQLEGQLPGLYRDLKETEINMRRAELGSE